MSDDSFSAGDKVVTIAAFVTSAEANLAQHILSEEGIDSCLENDVSVALVCLLSNALGGVKLQVHASDAERARAVLADKLPGKADQANASSAFSGGQCTKCGAELDPGFEVCWSCGEPVEAKAIAPVSEQVPIADSSSTLARSQTERPPQPEPAETEEETRDEADDLAKKAWFAAILGLFFCPPILHAYSAWLVFLIVSHRFPLSRQGARRLWFAAVIDFIVFALFGWVVLRLML
jgi:hypothetical protein